MWFPLVRRHISTTCYGLYFNLHISQFTCCKLMVALCVQFACTAIALHPTEYTSVYILSGSPVTQIRPVCLIPFVYHILGTELPQYLTLVHEIDQYCQQLNITEYQLRTPVGIIYLHVFVRLCFFSFLLLATEKVILASKN